MKENETHTHESYALVGFYRTQGSSTFFGSKIKCNSYITLKISHAKVQRHLHQEWCLSDGQIMEIKLSPNQFSELITSMNVGDGVPATITRMNGKRMEDPPYESEIKMFEAEIEESAKEVRDAIAKHEALLETFKLTKKEKSELHGSFCALKNSMLSNLPFVVQQAYRALEKGVLEAKQVVDSFITGTINRLGLKALQQGGENIEVKLLEEDKPENIEK